MSFEEDSHNFVENNLWSMELENIHIFEQKKVRTMWDEEKKEVVAVFGTLPGTYDELYCENQEEGEEHVDNG